MKKLLILTVLGFITYIVLGQSLEGSGQQIGGKPGLRTSNMILSVGDNIGLNPYTGSKTSYNTRASDFFKRVTDAGKTLTDAQKKWYNDSIFVPLSDSGLIGTTRAGDSLVCLYSFSLKWAGDSTVANMNLLDNSYNCIHYGTVVYTDSGFAGDGASGYLDTKFNSVNDSTIFKLNSASMGFYSKTSGSIADREMGIDLSSVRTVIIAKFVNDNCYTGLNGATQTPVSSGITGLGVYLITRRKSAEYNQYWNGNVLGATVSDASTSLVNGNVYIGAVNTGVTAYYSRRVITFGFIGSGLSSTKARALSNILNNSLKGYAYNVY